MFLKRAYKLVLVLHILPGLQYFILNLILVLVLNIDLGRVQLSLESRPVGSKSRFLRYLDESYISDLLFVYMNHATVVVELFVDSLAIQSTTIVELETLLPNFNIGLLRLRGLIR